jgi:hypothetical protein
MGSLTAAVHVVSVIPLLTEALIKNFTVINGDVPMLPVKTSIVPFLTVPTLIMDVLSHTNPSGLNAYLLPLHAVQINGKTR